MATLTAKNLAKAYKGRRVVEDVSLTVNSGEIVGLLGPNGAGKTTTFYMVVGIVPRDAGNIIIDDEDISLLPLHARARRGIGYLPQEASIFRRLSVFDNLMAVLQIRDDLTSEQRTDRANELMEEFHIEHLRDSLGQALSGGERRRVEIARALAANPKFILLDEPFAGVDPISVIDIKRIIEHLRDSGLGVLITDHNVRETLAVCERAYIVSQGHLIAHGTPQQILEDEHVKRVYLGEDFRLIFEDLLRRTDLHDEVDAQQTQDTETLDSVDALEQKEMPDELPLDASWDEIYTAGTPSGTRADYQDDELPVYQGETTQSLQDYLMWQVELTPFSDTDRAIATSIVDAVDDTGYLTVTLDEILESIGDDEIELEEIEAVLKRVQRFDPIGVAAKDLRDCLLIQLSQFAKETPWIDEARLIISDHLDLLANHDFRTLMRVTRLKEEVLKEAVNLIQSLDPRPGQSIQTSEPEYVIPDVLVRKHNGRWVVELNADSIPRLQINQQYASMCTSARNDADNQYIRSNLQEARWLIKSLESRNDTLLRVSRCIVEQQQAFFEQGEEFMKPMVLADIAQAVEMHESTISRVTTQKYLHSPRGIFELKYFFSSHVNTEGGGEASSTAIRALVKKLIAAENPAKPLSDSKLTTMLSDQGIMVARRTVAKYRESLSIPPSNQRKQLV